MPLAVVAKQFDTIRLAHNLRMSPPSDYYMAICRTLHSEEVPGPTAVSGWKRHVSGQPYVQSRNILIVVDSCTEIYPKSGKSHHSIVTDLRQHCGYSNIQNLTEVGAHPRRWLALFTNWETSTYNSHFPKSGRPDAAPYFGSDFVVIVIGVHNGLQIGNSYTGLNAPSGKQFMMSIAFFFSWHDDHICLPAWFLLETYVFGRGIFGSCSYASVPYL